MRKLLKVGDIILTSKESVIVRFMRFFQDDDIKYGHVAIVENPDMILEAGYKVRRVPTEKWFKKKKNQKYKILRMTGVTETQSIAIVWHIGKLVGQWYSVKRIFLQIFDHVTNSNWFTKRDRNKKNQVCSSLVAWGYYVVLKYKFNGVPWASCEPDDIDDDSEKKVDSYVIIKEA